MRPLDDFLPMLMASAPGCPYPTAISALRQSAIQFCEATRLWKCEDEFDVDGDACGNICVQPEAELFEIEAVTFNGRKLDPAAPTYLDRVVPRWREDHAGTGSPSYFTQVAPDSIAVVPSATGRVKVYAYLRPAEDATEVADVLSFKYRRHIVSGALAEVLMIPGQAFFSPDLASVHAGRFERAKNRNFNLNVRGQQRAPARTRFRFF